MTSTYASSILRKTLCHASQAQKNKTTMKRAKFKKIRNLQKPKPLVFILFALLLCCSAAWGQLFEWELQGSGEYKVTQDQLFSNISVSGSLILHVEENVKFKASTFNYGSKAMFKVDGGGSLTIYGNGKLTIDGQQNVTSIVNEGANNSGNSATAFACTSGANAKTQLIVKDVTIKNYVSNAVNGNNGVINFSGSNDQKLSEALLENVTIEDCYAGYANNDQNKPDLSGHPLYIYGRVVSIVNGAWDITMDHVTIRNCYVMEPEENYQWIENMGGLIRSQGGHAGQLKCKSCTFENNTYYDRWRTTNMNNPYLVGQGGAINWRSGGQFSADASHETKLIIEDCTFKENRAKRGGAIATNATMEIKNSASDKTTVFEKNEAELGGALYFWTYNGGQRAYDGRGFDIELGMDATSVIEVKNNYASKMGGGVYITIDPSHDIGFNASNVAIDAGFSVQAGAGAKIEKNRSPKGAGVAIIDNAALRHKIIDYPSYIDQVGHPTAGSWSGKYSRTVTFTGATVKGNYTSKRIGTDSWTTDEEAAGGGVYIVKKKFVSDEPAFAFDDDFKVDSYTGAIALGEGEAHGGSMTVDVLLGDYSGNSAQKYKFSTLSVDPQNDVLDDNNNKGNGGGFYIASLFEITDFKSYLNVNIGASNKVPEIYNNKATTHGGGIYIYYDRENGRDNGGNVNVLNGYIGKTQLATNNALNGNGGGLCVLGGTVTIGGGHVLYNTAANGLGGGIYVNVANESSITYINASTSGGIIGANISYNSALGGGGIYVDKGKLEVDGPTFGSGTYDPATDNTHTRITKNKATDGNGGGIDAGNGEVNITNALIYNNDAEGSTEDKGNGGGIYLDGGTIEINTSKILYDTAQISGGGICVVGGSVDMKSGDVGNNNAQNNYGGGICVLGGTVLVEGGNILSNTAKELGGGVYVSVPNATTTTTIRGGANISSNTAKGGGGVYVDKGLLTVYGPVFDSEYVYPIDPVTGNVNASYNPAAETHTRITNNWATDGNGGGIDAGNGTVEITNTLIYNNEARGTVSKGRGGGVYLDGGTIDITTSKILKNTAETNGGGIDDHSGDIDIYGGDISHNKATTGRGGGIYTNAGDILIWPSAMKDNLSASFEDCKNTGTLFSYNTAGTNGGGLNTHIGRLDVRYANVHHNEAGHNYQSIGTSGGSGGGMFCEGPHADLSGYTVRLLHTYLDNNKAFGNSDEESNLTGRGGGIYLKYGSIFAEHCYVRNNEADINGGGLDNHDGELRVYGSFVENNQAKNGKGGGLYTDKGNLVVGPCDSYGFVESKASRICNNTAYINGGGINNHEGDITIHGDRINNNTAVTGDGGGVYINSGQIYMYGGQINNNKADNGKGGGVYGGGGTFNIMEREAHPILEILDVENITTSGFTVHFHHVDRGNAMKPTASNKEYGIAFSESEYPSDLGENEYWGDNWQGVDTVKVGPTNGIPFPAQPHTYNQNEGCSRFIVHDTTCHVSITPNTTYYVVAYGKYTYGGKDYFDASPAVKVKTYGNNPVVVTGVAFDITTNSASVNGKLFYEGVGTLLEKGIEISSNYGATWEKHPAQSVGNVFSVTFSGLEPSRIYKARAYAISQNGGNQYESQDAEIITFFTLGNNPVVATGEATEITGTTATVSGKLLYAGDDPGTVTKGIEISSDYGANWEKHSAQSVGNVFSVTFSGLEPSRIYKARAYAISQNGGNQYESQDAEIITFFTLGNSPVVATGEATEITGTTATVSGKLLYAGDDPGTVTKGIRYRTGENEWTSVASSSTVDEFSVTLTGLVSGTDYQAQAYATKGENTGYGEIITFSTVTGSKAPQGPRSVYPAVEENPFFQELTPLQQAMLANALEGDTTAARATNNGTHRDDPDPAPPVDIPEINYNSAVYGGGICIDLEGANLIFAGSREASPAKLGQIDYNYASEAGGGIYIGRESADEYAQMQMMGKCEVNFNRVPAFKLGGGIYLGGRLYVGDSPNDNKDVHGLKVDRNFAISKDKATFEANIATILAGGSGAAFEALENEYAKALNNVFLPRSEYVYDEHATSAGDNSVSVITLLSDISGFDDKDNNGNYEPQNGDTPYSHIGFSVLKGFCPVIATSNEFKGTYDVFTPTPNTNCDPNSEVWLYNLMTMSGVSGEGTAEKLQGAVFEDSESYVAVHTRTDMAPFRLKYIYLWGCWTHPIVRYDPESKNPMSKKHGYEEAGEEEYFLGHYKIKNPNAYTTGEGENNGISTGTTALEWEIYSPEGLAWFTSYVNGLNVFDQSDQHKKDPSDPEGKYHFIWSADQNPKANAVIMNDLDMSAYLWVPIGSVQKFYVTALTDDTQGSLFVDSETQVMSEGVPDNNYSKDAHYYSGTFDGQGHIIKGLQGLYLTGIKKFGLFGYLDGATVKNTFVDDGLFVSDNVGVVYSAGGIAGEMKSGSISNSEARSNMNVTHCQFETKVGGLVGEMKAGSIHSSMAMPTMLGQNKGMSGATPAFKAFQGYMGGLVGKMATGTTLKNCYANVEMNLIDTEGATVTAEDNSRYIGGIVGYNEGLVENVYVRYNNADNKPDLPTNTFYWIAGGNRANTISYCFAPYGKIGDTPGEQWWLAPNGAQHRRSYKPTNLKDGKYRFAHKDQEIERFGDFNQNTNNNEYIDNGADGCMDKDGNLKGLLASLNKWVAANPDHTPWMRTMASTINDDYPVLMFNDFNVVGTEDGIFMKYDDDVNDMWKEPNYESLVVADRTGKNFQGLNALANPKAAMYLYKTNGVTKANSTPVAINVTGNTAVPLHIHENIGITQATVNDELTARVGVTFDNSDGTIANGGAPYDWHMFSSALKAAPLGITYRSNNTDPNTGGKSYSLKYDYDYASLQTEGITDDNYRSREYMDPPVIEWNTEEGTVGYFPTNTPYGTWGSSHWPNSVEDPVFNQGSFDYYCFHEPSRHWINFKREGTPAFMDHWHQDIDGSGKHQNLWYKNESTLQVGKGYMMGVSAVSMLMADGILNNGDVTSQEPLTNSEYSFNMSGYSEELRGTNLVGNPYQSYLDFDELADDPANNGIIHNKSYYLFDADAGRYICYPATASDNQVNAPKFIHPHQGFFVKTANGGKLTFNNDMRAATGNTESYFRNKLNYPLVNLFCYDAEGHYDVTTVEMNRPELGGGSKLKDKRNGNSLIYARMENEDYQTLFAPTGTSTVPVRFEPSQDGVYTMRWGTLHGDFHYLHLVDNMSGADVDMLRSEEYRFEATTTDYLSRFKLVFEVTGLEEEDDNEDDNGSSIVNFAFRMGDELIVNGAGYLEVFDVQGRRLSAKRLVDAQSSVSLPNVAAGIYFLRLSDDKQVRTQKMVINY